MSAQRVITQVMESEPLFVTLSHQPGWFTTQLAAGGIVWKHLHITVELDPEILNLLHEAYRIVLDVADCTPQEKAVLIGHLIPHQAKVKIILPIYSFWQLKVAGEVPGWQTATQWQRTQVLHWTSLLPDATVIFVRDVFDWQSSREFSSLLTQHLSNNLLFAPDGRVTASRKNDLTSTLIEEIGAPPRGSVLLQTPEHALTSLFERCVPLYESMYQKRIDQQLVETLQLELLPFPCRVRIIPTALGDAVDCAMILLPPPSQAQQLEKQLQTSLRQMQKDPWLLSATESTAAKRDGSSEHVFEHTTKKKIEDATLDGSSSTPHSESVTDTEKRIMTVESDTTPPPRVLPEIVTQSSDETVFTGVTTVEKEQQFKEDVRHIFSTGGSTQHAETLGRKSRQRRVLKKRSRKRTAVFYLGLTFVTIGLVLAALLGSLQVTQQLARREFVTVATSITESSTRSTKTVRWGRLPLLLSMMKPQQGVLSTIFSLPMIDTGQAMVRARTQLQELLLLNDTFTNTLVSIYTITSGQSTGDIAQATEALLQDLRAATALSDELTITIAQLPESINTTVASAAAQLLPAQGNRRTEQISKTLIPLITALTGATSQRRYAVVLQNSQELRPTGGFIEAIAILTFNGGSLTAQEVYSSYRLDTLLPDPIKPPLDLTTTVGESQWWLHDANWYADGAASGRQVAWFLEKALQQTTDGVIFLNTASFPQLLRAFGPLEMPDFNEVLTEKNIAERLEFHNELPSQVAVGRSDYRESLLEQLLLKLTTLPPEQVPTLYQTLTTLLDEKQILVFLTPPNEQQAFRRLGWTGDMTFPVCPEAYVKGGCVVDGLALIESNIGLNRANAYIERQQSHKAVLNPSGVHHERKIQYTNTAATSAWPKGDYKLYLRAYIPGRPTNIVVSFGGSRLTTTEIAIRDSEFGAEIAFVVTVPIASTKELLLSYDQTQPLSPTSTYVFYENRQAGLTDPLSVLGLSHPQEWRVDSHLPDAVQLDAQLQFPASPTASLMRIVQFSPAQ